MFKKSLSGDQQKYQVPCTEEEALFVVYNDYAHNALSFYPRFMDHGVLQGSFTVPTVEKRYASMMYIDTEKLSSKTAQLIRDINQTVAELNGIIAQFKASHPTMKDAVLQLKCSVLRIYELCTPENGIMSIAEIKNSIEQRVVAYLQSAEQ